MPSEDESIVLECFKCGAKHRFDKEYNHLEVVNASKQKRAEQDGA